MMSSHSFSVMLTSIRSRRMPALLTSTCRSPNASTAESIRRLAPSQSATSSWLAIASPPAATISSTTCWAGVASSPLPSAAPPRSLTTSLAPSAANSRACSRPIPRPAPVITATRFLNVFIVASTPSFWRARSGRQRGYGSGRSGCEVAAPSGSVVVDLAVADRLAHRGGQPVEHAGQLDRHHELGGRRRPELLQRVEVLEGHGVRVQVLGDL